MNINDILDSLDSEEGSTKQIILRREIISNKAILGTLILDGKEIAKTLENPWKNNEVDISCIPAGKYKCTIDNTGKFQWWRLADVQGRGLIEIHEGNRERDTQGCILIGESWGVYKEELAVLNSVATLNKIKPLLGKEFELNIVEN